MNLSIIEKIIEEKGKTSHFSGSILFGNQEQEYTKVYGFANRSEGIKNTVDTKFGIASGCKIFTAVAICQLVQEGKISLDSLLKECVDFEFPNFDPNITIHHLLTHSSGVPDYFDEEVMNDFEGLWREKPMYHVRAPKDFLPLFQYNHMKFKPGEQFAYNNAGYILLGLIVEKISGMEFTTYIENNIFRRCGMHESGYYRMDQLPAGTALGYIDEDQCWRTNIYSLPINGGPDGGAYTTVKDLKIFWNALLESDLLNTHYTKLLLTPHAQENEFIHYGYGVWILKINNEICKYFVMGSDPGVSMQSSVYTNGLHAHILGNTNVDTGEIARKIDEEIYKEI
ncbi:serine hydrolase domain-containing protein [Paenibacillus sp. An7]|uniref:serine hydrolase domain-containing protein n=1 Tax=Paenibacillus sp. An7 TaxID=2689577 RepID=UPI001358C3CB|nr:serine hydrolase domain-containing protein [Paenibacillus sp. An7]